jgi:4,4'-diaponeurosporenoate glycosyltransferase
MEQSGAGLLSVIPTHIVRSWWERLQGVFQLLLLIATRAARSAKARDAGERAFCIGQYLLFDRGVYEKLGGHEAVRHRVAEDLAFYRLVRAHGGQYFLMSKRGMVNVCMYPEGLGAFIAGWRRNFREGLDAAGVGGVLEVVFVIGWLLGLPIWLATAWAEGNGMAEAAFAGAYLVTGLLITFAQRVAGNFSAPGAFLFPLFAAIFVLATVLAVWDKVRQAPIRWRGRTVPRTHAKFTP